MAASAAGARLGLRARVGASSARTFAALLWVLSGLLLAFILLPLIRLGAASSAASLSAAARSSEVTGAIELSLQDAAITAAIATLLAVPLGFALARRRLPASGLVQAIVDLPLAVPHTVAGIALLFLLGREGWIGRPAAQLGIAFYGAQPGIVAAMLFVSVPFAVNSVRVAVEGIDPRLEQAARSLGGSPLYVFRRVTVPLAARGIVAGAALVYARALAEFGAVVIIAYYPATAPVEIYQLFLQSGLAQSTSAAVLLLIVALASFVVVRALAAGGLRAGARAGCR